MSQLDTLISDVDRAIERGSTPARTRTLARIMDLLVMEEALLRAEQLDVFDGVLARFTPMVDVPCRATLAERLSCLEKGPRNVIRTLAFDDEITVARPILARSRQIGDQDLIAIAAEKGPSHMLAICERPRLAETVTDVLVSLGDKAVQHAVAGNAGARFSEQGTAALIENSREDEALQISLGERHDLTTAAAQKLIEIARESAKRRILDALKPMRPETPERAAPGQAGTPVAKPVPRRDFPAGMAAVSAITSQRPLVELDLTRFASEGRDAATICTLAGLTGMPVPSAEHVFDSRDSDLLLLVGKAHKWSWATLRAMMVLRDREAPASSRLKQAEARFAAVTAAKARRTLQVLQLRGSLGGAATSGVPSSLRHA